MAAWRGDEEDPFHTEIGYWMWDATRSEIYRCVMVPRATVVLAGGVVAPDVTTFTLSIARSAPPATACWRTRTSASTRSRGASRSRSQVGEDTWSYEESMNVYISRLGKEMQHKDGNTLTRVAE